MDREGGLFFHILSSVLLSDLPASWDILQLLNYIINDIWDRLNVFKMNILQFGYIQQHVRNTIWTFLKSYGTLFITKSNTVNRKHLFRKGGKRYAASKYSD